MIKELQQNFANYLLNEEASSLKSYIDPKYQDNISVHYDTFHERLIKILQNNFSQTEKLLGNEYFYQLAKEFCNKNLKTGSDLHNYGDDFPNFVQKHKITNQLPYIAEFLNLEHKVNSVLYLKKTTEKEIANADQSLQTKIKIIETNYNLRDIWYFTFNENDSPPKIITSPYKYLIFRNESINILEISP